MGGKSGIILVTGFSFILSYISLNLSKSATRTIENMAFYNQVTSSHSLATAGANVGLSSFYQDTSWRGPITQELSNSNIQGSFTARIVDLGVDKCLLRSISTYPISPTQRLHDTIEVYFNKTKYNSFSMFAWMTNFEGNVFWISKDTVWGRVHSNGAIHVNGKPVFMEKVTEAKAFDPKPGTGTNKAIFKNGYETGVATIDFPNDFSDLISAGQPVNGGRTYNSEIWVTLSPGSSANNDGQAYIRGSESGPIIDSIALSDPSFSGVILGTGKVNVQGTLDGRLSITSLSNLYIQNDVLYESDPRLGNSDDLLGLLAEKDIVVVDNLPNSTNCVIHASIFSRDGSFTAEHYNTRSANGELHVLGSIVQYVRGPVGTFNSQGDITHGFSKRYRYDQRLADPTYKPPHYPGYYVKTYAITNWWESYHKLETDN